MSESKRPSINATEDREFERTYFPDNPVLGTRLRERFNSRSWWLFVVFASDLDRERAIQDFIDALGYHCQLQPSNNSDKAELGVWPCIREGRASGTRQDAVVILMVAKELVSPADLTSLLAKFSPQPIEVNDERDFLLLSYGYYRALANVFQVMLRCGSELDN